LLKDLDTEKVFWCAAKLKKTWFDHFSTLFLGIIGQETNLLSLFANKLSFRSGQKLVIVKYKFSLLYFLISLSFSINSTFNYIFWKLTNEILLIVKELPGSPNNCEFKPQQKQPLTLNKLIPSLDKLVPWIAYNLWH